MKLKGLIGLAGYHTFVFVKDASDKLKSTCPVYRLIPNQAHQSGVEFFNVCSGQNIRFQDIDDILDDEIKLLVL